ncbi:hypothetical protein [Bradyrhizobium sp. CCBAU 51753]|uniref:hypothetical protein n=1 Tax=Bradyrhizobium sp. CCBAU 51753 TaxID=1325100 RepID=UPI0018C0224E|nr:hypothetical protein [Bradyrhizobium sp. CCBAU 51753]QOZ24100.1 hypothetical protein XH93_11335 [Bradyrhizobium sp. CCBAU 51753]
MPLETYTAYSFGVLGSAAIEIAAALRMSVANGGGCPPIYKKPFFLCARILFAVAAAGPLPVLMDSPNLWSAFYYGISAPVIFDRLARGLQQDDQISDDSDR